MKFIYFIVYFLLKTRHEKSYFPSFPHVKISYIVSFQHTRKHDTFLARKRKKRLSYRMFSMVQERRYFLHQKISDKVILKHILAILENLILSENDTKNYISSCAGCSIKNYFTLSPMFLKTFFGILVALSLGEMIRKFGYILIDLNIDF